MTTYGRGKSTGPPGFGPAKSGEEAKAVLFVVHVPAHWRQLHKKEIRRRLGTPEMTRQVLDAITESIETQFKTPVDYRMLVQRLTAAIDASKE